MSKAQISLMVSLLTHTHSHKLVNTGKRGPPIVPLLFIRNTSHMFCTRLANGGLFATGDPIVPFVISPRFECLNKRTHTHCTHGTYGVLHCLLFCDQTQPNLRISLVGYHCAIEFPCGVLLFYCCKYPTTYGVRVHTVGHVLMYI